MDVKEQDYLRNANGRSVQERDRGIEKKQKLNEKDGPVQNISPKYKRENQGGNLNKKRGQKPSESSMVPEEGLEPSRQRHTILSRARLPIPTLWHNLNVSKQT